MIRSEAEYKEAVARLSAEKSRISEHKSRLRESGLNDEEIKCVTDPMASFHMQFVEEVESYERLRRGEFEEIVNFKGAGRLLVALRIAQSISQRELAKRLDVHESQVSRDERNEYFGITVERASKILDALGSKVKTTVDVDSIDRNREVEFA